MSTLELEHLKHTSSSSNNLSTHSDGSLTVGNLQSLNVLGNLTVDTSTLKVDATNNRVGIGTASPAATLTVAHASGTDGRGIRLVNSSNNQTYETRIGTEGIENTSYSIRDMTADVVRFSIDGSGRVTMPAQPAWWAHTYNTYSFTATGTLEFNSTNVGIAEKLDVGNNYNPITGRFTAPVAGTYFVMLTCAASYSSNYLYLYIMKNGSDIISRNYAQNSQYLEQTLQVVTTLAVGDYVSCKTEKNLVGGALYGPSFSGFLIG